LYCGDRRNNSFDEPVLAQVCIEGPLLLHDGD